jgi:hypothetical protein
MKPELKEQILFCQWVKESFPDVTFMSDLYDKLNQAGRMQYAHLRSGDNPDMFFCVGKHRGLFIEMKATGTVLINKKGELYKEFKHQFDELTKLRNEGYDAIFCCGLEEAKSEFLMVYNEK